MNLFRSFLYLVLCMIVCACFSLPGFTATPVVNLNENASGVKNVSASVIINAPCAVVWEVITNYNRFTTFMPGIKQFNILSNAGSKKSASIKLDVSSFMKAFNYQASIVENSASKTVLMTRTSGDFNMLKLKFTLKALDNNTKTMITYSLNVDHGKHIPNGFANRALKGNALKTLKAIDQVSLKNYSSSKIASK